MNANQLIFQTLSPIADGLVFPSFVPESERQKINNKPYLVYTPISSTPLNTMDGYEHHEHVLMQIDVYAPTFKQSENLMQSVMTALDEAGCEIGTRQSLPDTNPKLYRQSLDVYVWGTTY